MIQLLKQTLSDIIYRHYESVGVICYKRAMCMNVQRGVAAERSLFSHALFSCFANRSQEFTLPEKEDVPICLLVPTR